MPGPVWPRVSYLIYFRGICLCHCVTFPVITSIEEMLTTRYISDQEKVEGRQRPSWNTFDYEQNRTIVLFMSFLSAKWQIKSWNSTQASFACGIQARPVGGHNILLARCKYYLLPRQRYHRNWV